MTRFIVVFIAVQIVFAVGYYLSGVEIARCVEMSFTFVFSAFCGLTVAGTVTLIDR